jgi:hypothetical protein
MHYMSRPTQPIEPKSRQKLAAENMTRVQKLTRVLQCGQLKSELRTVQEAIHMARGLYTQIESEGLKPQNDEFAVHIAYMTPDLSMLFTRRFKPGKDEAAQIQADLASKCCIMVGLIFGMKDPDHDNEWLIGARPFLNTPLVVMALQQRVESEFAEMA